jgi:hypothetical protein
MDVGSIIVASSGYVIAVLTFVAQLGYYKGKLADLSARIENLEKLPIIQTLTIVEEHSQKINGIVFELEKIRDKTINIDKNVCIILDRMNQTLK